jgi:thiamine-monophosphate kinase
MIGEDELIARYFAPLAGPAGLGLQDDVALFAPPPHADLVLSVDGLVAGVHFFPEDPPDLVARKALRVNLSDLAAKGAEPLGFALTLALPRDFGEAALAAFSRGLGEDSRAYHCPLLGGDTVATPGPLTLSITVLGQVPSGRAVRRSGARPGDRLYVSGSIGDAALGLRLRLQPELRGVLSESHAAALADRYLLPRPRLALREALRSGARAAMDVSDGLVGDLAKLARASHVGAELRLAETPFSQAAQELLAGRPELLEVAVTGGDDYEVLCAVPPDRAGAFEAAARASGVPVHAVGTVLPERDGVRVLDRVGAPRVFARPAFSHF